MPSSSSSIPRNELFFSEKRPFFLDGIEQFTTPNQLIYTRRIIQPVAAAKLTGKAFGTDLALLTAVDDRAGSATGADHPIYNLLRIQRDIGSQSRLGVVYTDKIDGANYNRVAGADARLVFGGVYSAQLQLAGSRTRQNGDHRDRPALVGPVCSQRPHLRTCATPLPASTRTSGPRAASSPGPGSSTPPRPQRDGLRKARAAARELHRRRDAGRHLGVPTAS